MYLTDDLSFWIDNHWIFPVVYYGLWGAAVLLVSLLLSWMFRHP